MDDLKPALTLIKSFESCRLVAYQDIVGRWTIGWGTAEGVQEGMVVTQEKADELLLDDVTNLYIKIISILKVEASNSQICALVSFAYNLGLHSLYHSTLLTELNSGLPREDVAKEFLKWDHAGGQVVAGLTRRRRAEADLFLA